MSKAEQLAKLQGIVGTVLDSRLAALRAASASREETKALLSDLSTPVDPDLDLMGIASARAALTYQRWADARREELNQLLARQTVAWMEARDCAKEAFGKAQALDGVTAKLGAGLRKSD